MEFEVDVGRRQSTLKRGRRLEVAAREKKSSLEVQSNRFKVYVAVGSQRRRGDVVEVVVVVAIRVEEIAFEEVESI